MGGTTAEEKPLHQKEPKGTSLYMERKVMVGDEKSVRAMIHPMPSDLDSRLIVRVSYDQGNKHAENSVFDLFLPERMSNRCIPEHREPEELNTRLDHKESCHHHPKHKDGKFPNNLPLFGG